MKKLVVMCLCVIGLTACASEPINEYSYTGQGGGYQTTSTGSSHASSGYQTVHTGKRGGQYVITSGGNKRYLKRK